MRSTVELFGAQRGTPQINATRIEVGLDRLNDGVTFLHGASMQREPLLALGLKTTFEVLCGGITRSSLARNSILCARDAAVPPCPQISGNDFSSRNRRMQATKSLSASIVNGAMR